MHLICRAGVAPRITARWYMGICELNQHLRCEYMLKGYGPYQRKGYYTRARQRLDAILADAR